MAAVGVFWYMLNANKSNENKIIKIGAVNDLSGDYVSLFRGITRGINFAVDDLKKDNIGVKLIIEDHGACDAQKTVTAINKLVNIDNVDMIIGGTCSNTTLVAAPIANQSKTIMISPSSSAPSISQAGDYLFRTYISDMLRTEKAGELVYQLGKRKMAIITDTSNDAAVELSKGTKDRFTSLGGQVVDEEGITKTDTDFRTQLTKIKNSKPDVLCLIITSPNQYGIIGKQIKEFGLNVQLISPLEAVENPDAIKIAGNTLNNLIYIMPGNPPETQQYKDLAARYKEKYNEDVPSYFTESYDAVMLGVKAILASNGTKEDIKNKLYEVSKTYKGVSGNTTFDRNGDVHKDVFLKVIKDGQFVAY